MADRPEQDRTEEATPRRREEAHDEGRIPRSQELTVAVSLLGAAAALTAVSPLAGRGLLQVMGHGLASVGTMSLDAASATQLLRETGVRAFASTLGLIAALTTGSFVMAALQARGVMSLKPIMPQWSRLDPTQNIKNLLGFRPIVELLKSIGK